MIKRGQVFSEYDHDCEICDRSGTIDARRLGPPEEVGRGDGRLCWACGGVSEGMKNAKR